MNAQNVLVLSALKSGSWGYFVGCSECKWTKKPFELNTTWETYQELPKDLGIHPDLGEYYLCRFKC